MNYARNKQNPTINDNVVFPTIVQTDIVNTVRCKAIINSQISFHLSPLSRFHFFWIFIFYSSFHQLHLQRHRNLPRNIWKE